MPWFAQLDSATNQGRRMCFTSGCAMIMAFLKPGVLSGPKGDDQYLARVRHFGVADSEQRASGDTTDPAAQIEALARYGIKARFTNQASFASLKQQIEFGVPVPCGYLHRCPISSPGGGGHWLIVVGLRPTHLIVHDPLEEAGMTRPSEGRRASAATAAPTSGGARSWRGKALAGRCWHKADDVERAPLLKGESGEPVLALSNDAIRAERPSLRVRMQTI